jgi:hypothetical protein
VETSNLDGERNLKRYFALGATNKLNTPALIHERLGAIIKINEPNQKLYHCDGVCVFQREHILYVFQNFSPLMYKKN